MDFQYREIHIHEDNNHASIRINRPEFRNSLSTQLVDELTDALLLFGKNCGKKIIFIEGNDQFFCTGKDFTEFLGSSQTANINPEQYFVDKYMALLRCISTLPAIVVANVRGQALAGGIGIVAACDYVLAASDAQFGLPELIWGLLPSMVIPYLIKRVGFRTAYKMTLTAASIGAMEAKNVGLVDEILDSQDMMNKRLIRQLGRYDSHSIGEMKKFFREMWFLNHDMEQIAGRKTAELSNSEKVKRNIQNFVEHGKFPWE